MKLLISICITLVLAAAVSACDCSNPSVRQKFRSADLVFLGTVVSQRDAGHPKNELFFYVVTLTVDKRWKGSVGKNVDVMWAYDVPGMCNDLPLVKDRQYLIYTNHEADGYGVFPDCGTNYSAQYRKEEIKKLDSFWFRSFARVFPFPKF